MSKIKVGFAMCGSFCTFSKAIDQMKNLADKDYKVVPIMSFNAYSMNTRFGEAKKFQKQIQEICGENIINSIEAAEPIGPKNMVDIIIVAPCTGNTLAKLCSAITDTPVTMACKSQLRVNKPVLICLATNDALGASAQNIGKMINYKNIYFVPLSQDDTKNKPNSLVADFELISPSLEFALKGKQIQPILM